MALTRQVTNLEALLLKQQAAFGTAETSLAAADFAEVMEGASVTFEPTVTERRYVGANSGNGLSIVGPLNAGIKFSLPIRSGGAEASGLLGTVLPAFGLLATGSSLASPGTNDKWVYTVSEVKSNWKDLTAWAYSGNKGTTSSVLRKISNILLGGKMILNFEEGTGVLECEGRGIFNGAPTDATQETCTPSTVGHPAMRSIGAFTLFGDSDYTPLSFEVDFNQDAVVTVSPTGTYGLGLSDIVRKGLRWRARVYQDTVANITPESSLIAGTSSTLSIIWGAVPNKFTITSSKIQITKADRSDQNGVGVYDLEGHFVDNDFSFTMETVTA